MHSCQRFYVLFIQLFWRLEFQYTTFNSSILSSGLQFFVEFHIQILETHVSQRKFRIKINNYKIEFYK